MTEEQRLSIDECYRDYCEIIKPLIAQIEALSEKLPLPLFNEIRAFNDHVARCHYGSPTETYINSQIERAKRHIVRMSLDCFKCLNVILYQKIEVFEHQTRNIDLTVIDNGVFYPWYINKKTEAASLVREAKVTEAQDSDKALEYYQDSFNKYSEIVNALASVSENVKWARARFRIRRSITIFTWIISIIASAVISAIFSCELIAHFFNE